MFSKCIRENFISDTINTLSKLGKHGAISLTPTVLSFVIFDDCTPRRILAQCILDQKFFFNEYTVVGVSEEHNQICLQFYPGNKDDNMQFYTYCNTHIHII